MLRQDMKYLPFSYDGYFGQKQNPQTQRNPIKLYSYKDEFSYTSFQKKSKQENIYPQNIQEHYVQYVILELLCYIEV